MGYLLILTADTFDGRYVPFDENFRVENCLIGVEFALPLKVGSFGEGCKTGPIPNERNWSKIAAARSSLEVDGRKQSGTMRENQGRVREASLTLNWFSP